MHIIAQANNALLFPGIGLGVIVSRSKIITNKMFTAAAHAVFDLTSNNQIEGVLLPPVQDLRSISEAVASAVAQAAITEGVAENSPKDLALAVKEAMWLPQYAEIRAI